MANFQAIEQRYGEVVAFSILLDLERHARINSTQLAGMDLATRFERAVAQMGGQKIAA